MAIYYEYALVLGNCGGEYYGAVTLSGLLRSLCNGLMIIKSGILTFILWWGHNFLSPLSYAANCYLLIPASNICMALMFCAQ